MYSEFCQFILTVTDFSLLCVYRQKTECFAFTEHMLCLGTCCSKICLNMLEKDGVTWNRTKLREEERESCPNIPIF
jgi:hypothetical protein